MQPQVLVTDVTVVETGSLKDQSTKEQVEEYFGDIPELVNVAFCESSFRHYLSDGKVLRGESNSADVGVMQINEKYHLQTAQELGMDIYSLEGNMKYARHLYETQGVSPWKYSKDCWNDMSVAMK